MCPTPFLYRFPGKRGPGPVLSKYWHTSGNFPTGLDTPFRLSEFHATYVFEHVPEEVEHWLRCVLHDPVAPIQRGVVEFMQLLHQAPLPDAGLPYQRAELLGASAIARPLQRAMEELGVEVPVLAVRAAAALPDVRARLLSSLHSYREEVMAHASTPHRRWAADGAQQVSEPLAVEAPSAASVPELAAAATAAQGAQMTSPLSVSGPSRAIQAALTLPPAGSVARDEALLVQSLCTLAEGCDRARFGNTTAAERLLRRARGFARDDPEVAAPVESNLASVCNRAGRFAEAEEHAREAVLLARKPHAYANWATAVAYQDDLDRALEIAEEGRSYHPDSLVLESTFKSLAATATGREAVPQPARGMRYHRAEQRAAAAHTGAGVHFGGQWDFVSFRRKLTNPAMDPSSQDLGTAMRRANIATLHISTTNIEETG